jgi:hypothetical protein
MIKPDTSPYTRRCPTIQKTNGRACMQPAGSGTKHKGWGRCFWHGGAQSPIERTWAMAMELADELDMNPLEALLYSVKVAGAHAAWADLQLKEAIKRQEANGGELGDEPSPPVERWLVESRKERQIYAKTAKAAVDAGVAAALVQRVEMESTAVAEAVMAVVDALDLDPAQRNVALGAAQERLLAIAGSANELPDIQGLSER